MKKITIFVLSIVLLLSMTACACTGGQTVPGNTPAPNPTEAPDPINIDALADIMTAILKDAPIEAATGESAVEAERFSWIFGIEPIEGAFHRAAARAGGDGRRRDCQADRGSGGPAQVDLRGGGEKDRETARQCGAARDVYGRRCGRRCTGL